MNIALVGMPVREAAVLTIFVGVGVKGWTCKTVAFRAGLALPSADLYIIDLAGVGLAQWSVKAEADLLTLLGGSHALLLTVATNASWAGKAQGCGRQRLTCLSKPYSTELMRTALAGLGAGGPSLAPVRPEATAAAWPSRPVAAAPRAAVARAAPRLPLLDSLQALRTMFPELGRHLFLARLLDMAATEQPHELRLTLHHSLILHPAQGWVAHNAAPGMLERLMQDGSTVATMSMRELGSGQALLRAEHIGSTRASLDTFLWRLAESSIGQQTPPVQCDAELKLRSIPGFTRIPGVGNLSLQLAAICVRLPQTLSSLRAAFPEHDPCEIARFVLLSTVSGLGDLSLVTGGGVSAKPSARLASSAVRAPTGFFRAMLQKLF